MSQGPVRYNNTRGISYDAAGHVLTETDAMLRVSRYTYDPSGNRITMTDPAGGVTAYTYDALNRVTQVAAPGAVTVSSAFDAAGRQTQMIDSTGTTTYAYDAINRLIGKTVPGGKSVSYTYDAAGNVTGQTDFAGQIVTRSYDKRNRLVSVTPADTTATSYTYDGANRWLTRTFPAGIFSQVQRDAAGNVTQFANKRADGTVISSFQYSVDSLGRVSSILDQAGTSVDTYDVDGRLLTYTEPGGSVTTYAYDGAGNRTARSVTTGAVTETTAYSYDASDRLLTVTPPTGGPVSYSYDLNGNMVGDGTRTFAYDGLNRLTAVQQGAGTVATYSYDGTNLRTQKTTAAGTVQYYYDGDRVLNEGDGAANITKTNLWGLQLLRRTAAGQNGYYLYNGHGDVTSVVDSAGLEVGAYRYDDFGRLTSTTGTADNPFRYTTEPFDEETGLIYLRARYYSPDLGRFVTQDSWKGDPWQPWTQNLYVYVGNNPVNYTDPTGHCPWCIGAGIGAVGGGVAGGIYGYKTNGCFWCWKTWGDVGAGALGGAVVGGTFGAAAGYVAELGGAAGAVAAVNSTAMQAASSLSAEAGAEPATVEELVQMMNERVGVTAEFATGDAAAYLEQVGAEGSHMLMEDGTSSILLRADVATRQTALHEWLHHVLQSANGEYMPGEDKLIEDFLARHADLFKLNQ